MSWFIHPALAWSALALAAVPLVIHLINRRRLRRLDWAAMEFLLMALRRSRRRLRLEQLVLLLCRMALMVLVALFLARPFLPEHGFGWLAGPFQSEEKIFILDDSLSMAARHGAGTSLEEGARALGAALRRLAEGSRRDRITVLRSSCPDAPLVRGVFADRERAAHLERTLAALEPTGTRLELERALGSVVEQAARSAEAGRRPRAVSVITDLRAGDWVDGAGGPRPPLREALEKLAASPENPARVVVLDVGAEDAPNAAIIAVVVEGGRPTAGIPVELRVAVRNFGSLAVRDLRVTLHFGSAAEGEAAESMTVLAPPPAAIEPGRTEQVTAHATFQRPGRYWGRAVVSGSGDRLDEDNTYSFVLTVVESTEVLLVDGEPSARRFAGETDFLAASLEPGGEVASGIEPLVVVEDHLPASLERFAAVFLANVYSLPPAFRSQLQDYVHRGGALVIFPGDQVDAAVYARELGEGPGGDGERTGAGPPPGAGLLPARLARLQSSEGRPVGLSPSCEHYLFRFLRGGGERYLEELQFHRYFTLEPLGTSRVLARFAGGGNSPALVEGTYGSGTVLLAASSADLEWNDWPRHPTFLPVVQRMVELFGRSRAREPEHLAGAALEIPLDITEYAREVRCRPPGYPGVPERLLLAAPGRTSGASFRVVLEETSRTGHGFLGLTRREGGEEEWRALAIRSDPEESDLRRIEPSRLKELYPDAPLEVVRTPALFLEAGRGQFEISDILMAAFLVLLFIEGYLACRFAHHQRRQESAARAGRIHS